MRPAARFRLSYFIQHLTRRLRASSIRSIMTWSFSVFVVLVVIMVAVLLFDRFSRTAERSAYINSQQIVDQVSYNLEDYIQSMSRLYRAIEVNMLEGGQWDGPEVTERLDTIMGSREDIVSIALFDQQGRLLVNRPSLPVRASAHVSGQSWFHAALRVPGHLSFSLPHVQNLYADSYKWVVSMSKGITVIRNGRPESVILLVDINFRQIDELCSRVSLGKKGYVYIIDEGAGNMVYHPQQQLIYMGLKRENVDEALKVTEGYLDEESGLKRLNTTRSLANIGWKVVGVAYLDEVMTTRAEVNRYLIQVVGVVLVLVIIVSMLLSATLTRPIRRMERTMKAVERGDFAVELPVGGPLEVERLSSRFNLMLRKIRQLMEQIIEEQESKRKYELEALQAQINPHFLYNTLNSVVRMVGMSKNEDVVTMITSLSKLFRISLSKGKTVITVREELEHARHYLTIQQMRFKRKFQFEIEAEEQAQDCLTLKLVLQPLIENAIVHGIEYMVDEGFIRITARVTGQTLMLEICDNGVGMPPEKASRLLSADAPQAQKNSSGAGSGVGVKNVHDRIQLYYGAQYGLKFESELEEGTTVRIRMPAVAAPEGEADHE
ncbi:sensor histidine kinase [Paenibacillus sambharensis]|uniref:histidine kinase n=1 Tax=Paenibacillus sambharensis TaxID=1803190 RepID=A0A2W1LBF0_9BACL|nr:sensor histidine kinase [Paenibacillus sambharensis]PZD95450.1 sensor histidine kinase [Paenibacillus sambharensis]